MFTAKDKLELSQSQFGGEGALDELSCDNTSWGEEAGGATADTCADTCPDACADTCPDADTYVLTDTARARCYVLTDALDGRVATILDPAPQVSHFIYYIQ